MDSEPVLHTEELVNDVVGMVASARQRVAVAVNREVSMLYWLVGQRILRDILGNERAAYGKRVIETVAGRLTEEFGSGWSVRHLRVCVQVAEIFSNEQIWHTLCAELSWSHIRLIASEEQEIKREFYIELAKIEGWSVRQLQERMQSMLFERTAISRKPELTIKNDLQLLRHEQKMTPDLVFRDPYFLDFLGLKDTYSERDLETAILAELQRFIIELGSDFAFLARQKRIIIDGKDFYIDLLFYHRRLRCLVPIDLKLGDFEAGDKGQMELYLRYLERYEMMEGENKPMGLILCAGKYQEHVDLLQLDKSNITVAEYLTVLPPKELLLQKLKLAIEIARERQALGDKA